MQPNLFRVHRNPNYFASLKIVVRDVIWAAPSSFFHTVGWAIANLAVDVFMFAATFGGWVFVRVCLIGVGLAGFLTESTEEQKSFFGVHQDTK
jgi:hypothetical protein